MAVRTLAWWKSGLTTEQVASQVCDAAAKAWAADAGRRTRLLNYSRTYLDRKIAGLSPDQYNSYPVNEADQVRIGLTRSMVDSVQARIAKNRPKPTALTERAGFEKQQQAKRQDAFVWGVFSREKAYRRGPDAFKEGMIYGDGLTKVRGEVQKIDGKLVGRIRHERVFPWEVFVDEREAYYGKPRTMYQIHNIDRGVLKQLFPEMAARIDDAPSDDVIDYTGIKQAELSDRLQVIEAWRLPSGPNAKDGLHVITLKKLVLNGTAKGRGKGKGVPWTRKGFPFARFQWSKPTMGFWGQGLVETSTPVNTELNELARKIQVAMFWNSRPVTVVDDAADVEYGDLDNDQRGNTVRVKGGGGAIQFTVPQSAHAEVYAHMDRLVGLGYSMEGISELSAGSRKPAGLDSGKALLDFNDIESERFILRGQGYEDYFLDLADLTLLTARDLDAAGAEVEATAEVRRFRKRFIDKIKWSEVRLEEDQFELKCFPTSSLPHTPAGKRQAVEGLLQSGFISREQAMELMDLPDVDAVMQRELAPYEIILHQMESILEDGVLVAPIPYQDLAMALKVSQTTMLRAVIDEVPAAKRDLLQQFISAVEQLIPKPEAAPPGAPVQPEQVAPDAVPMETAA